MSYYDKFFPRLKRDTFVATKIALTHQGTSMYLEIVAENRFDLLLILLSASGYLAPMVTVYVSKKIVQST